MLSVVAKDARESDCNICYAALQHHEVMEKSSRIFG
jgi:hypothetical protein